MSISDFVHTTIREAKPILEDVGFRQIKITHLNVDKDKVYRYFGSLPELIELVLLDEVEKCYSYIESIIFHNFSEEDPLALLDHYRSSYIAQNRLLVVFHSDVDHLPNKLKSLIVKVESMEKARQIRLLIHFDSLIHEDSKKDKNLYFS